MVTVRMLSSVFFSFTIAFFMGWFGHSFIGDPYFGQVEVLDGDTIKLGSREFKFRGVQAMDGATADRDMTAQKYLSYVIADRFVWCRNHGDHKDNALLAYCYAGVESLNKRMVTEGFAADCARTSHGRYAELQTRSKESALGLWKDHPEFESADGCVVTAASIPDAEAMDDPASGGNKEAGEESPPDVLDDAGLDEATDEITDEVEDEDEAIVDTPDAPTVEGRETGTSNDDELADDEIELDPAESDVAADPDPIE
jgi:endonuclease YncB( thermonuclease family)